MRGAGLRPVPRAAAMTRSIWHCQLLWLVPQGRKKIAPDASPGYRGAAIIPSPGGAKAARFCCPSGANLATALERPGLAPGAIFFRPFRAVGCVRTFSGKACYCRRRWMCRRPIVAWVGAATSSGRSPNAFSWASPLRPGWSEPSAAADCRGCECYSSGITGNRMCEGYWRLW